MWALVLSSCGTQAAELTEALVKPAVTHSAKCGAQPAAAADTTTLAATVRRLLLLLQLCID